MFLSAAFLASVIASVSAHATFQQMWVNGVDQGSYCVRLPQSNSPVTDVTSTVSGANLFVHVLSFLLSSDRLSLAMRTHHLAQTSATSNVRVVPHRLPFRVLSSFSCEAGDEITVEMHQHPRDRSCANEAIGGAHYGPMIVRSLDILPGHSIYASNNRCTWPR